MSGEQGSVTIETAIGLTVVISVVLTLSLFARVAYVQGVVQHALVQTANEMAAYSYFYSMTGLNQINGAIVDKKLSAESQASDAANTAKTAVCNVSNVFEQFTNGKYAEASGNLGQAWDSTMALKDINITETLKSFCIALAGEAAEGIKTALINNVTRPVLQTYLPDDQMKFYKVGMFVDENGEYIDADSNHFPIDLSYSTYFSNEAADEIYLVAAYDLKLVTPIPVLDDPITIVQSAKARAWFASWDESVSVNDTEDEDEDEDEESVWDLPDAQRASKIASTNSALNLNENFKTIRGFNSSTGKASMFATIDIRTATYSGKSSAIASKIKSKITSLENYKDYKLMGKEVKVDDIKSVDYYVYIPKDATAAEKTAVRTAVNSIEKEAELSNGEKVTLNIIVKEVK